MRLILPSYLIVSEIIFITVLPNVSASGALSGFRGPTPYTPREVAAIREESFIYQIDNRSVLFTINRHTQKDRHLGEYWGLKEREKSTDRSTGGSKGGHEGSPPGSPNSFNFMQFWGKFGKIVCWRPPWGNWCPLIGEILDPPLE